jgi:hypothetical protein
MMMVTVAGRVEVAERANDYHVAGVAWIPGCEVAPVWWRWNMAGFEITPIPVMLMPPDGLIPIISIMAIISVVITVSFARLQRFLIAHRWWRGFDWLPWRWLPIAFSGRFTSPVPWRRLMLFSCRRRAF